MNGESRMMHFSHLKRPRTLEGLGVVFHRRLGGRDLALEGLRGRGEPLGGREVPLGRLGVPFGRLR